jgi:4-diphosphocytidyl-2-C-methyl-D-erythritol kinase
MSGGPGGVRVRACAKINLTLRVLGIRADGYHDLRTIFQTLALHDTLTFHAVRGPFELTTDDPSCPADRTNLVWQAAAALWEAIGRRGELSGVRVHLRKRIPAESGLGGGSSDAGSTLKALRMLWRARVDDADLMSIARGLGADVPFFLRGGTALGVDRGDLLFPLADPQAMSVVLARPDFGVSTRDAYRWWDEADRSAAGLIARPRKGSTILSGAIPESEWRNDLEPQVVARRPAIGQLIAALRRAGADHAAMSGSGSAVFALFRSRERAAAVAARVSRPSVRTWTTRTLSGRQCATLTTPEAAP